MRTKRKKEKQDYSCSPFWIRYTFRQCTWLLENLKDLREGIYPPDLKETNYTDPLIINKTSEYKAFTENIGTIVGTLERWLLQLGNAGTAAYLRWGLDLSYSEIGKLLGMSKAEAYDAAIRAIKYCVAQGEKLPKR